MQYRDLGKTGIKISALGFGAMRLPMCEDAEGQKHVDEEPAIELLRYGFDQGVNYVDTAYPYCEGESEIVVGKAIKGYRDKVYLSSKMPTWKVKETSDYRRFLEEQLTKLNEDYLDVYHFHALNENNFKDTVLKYKLLEEAVKAKEEGLIKHIAFSFHDKPEKMIPIIDTGIFESVLCQYNLLDQANTDSMAYANEKGLGVVVMGPIAGGRLGSPSDIIQEMLAKPSASTPELALRFVLANSNVSCALSGMSEIVQVEENARICSNMDPLSQDEEKQVLEAIHERRALADLYCTGCGYCVPCPQEVNIPACFEAMNYYNIYHLKKAAQDNYNAIGSPWKKGKKADACIDCGICEGKCPQNIPIREQLKQVHKTLG